MIHHLYTHYWQPWSNKMKRINGAFTYSADICEFYIPHLKETIDRDYGEGSIVVSTAAPFSKYNAVDVLNQQGQFDYLVQFLHNYPKLSPLAQIEQTQIRYGQKFHEIIFITAYRQYADLINQYSGKGQLSAKFLPMRVGRVKPLKPKGNHVQTAVWFGNVYSEKKLMYELIEKTCRSLGVKLITIKDGKMYTPDKSKGQGISQRDAWQVCANSGIVFAVGRCALEAYSLGCHVIICGNTFGGVVRNEQDWNQQESTNFNTRTFTGPYTIIQAIDEAVKERALQIEPYVNRDKIFCESLVSSGLIKLE